MYNSLFLKVFRVFNTKSKEILLVIFLVFILGASILDLLTDLSYGVTTAHLIQEAIVATVSLIVVFFLLFSWYRQKHKIAALQYELENIHNTKISAPQYVQDSRVKLSAVITQQFIDWKLSGSEKEIAWLLLKGLSLREISVIRKTKEKTIRQQASSIYKKSGLAGRHVLSAWFIEDIL